MTFTAEQLAAEIEDQFDYSSEFWHELKYSPEGYQLEGFPEIKWVEGYTGGEGGGSNAYVVFSVGDRLFKKDGYYASHYGTDWDGNLYEVEPYEKTVTLYRPLTRPE